MCLICIVCGLGLYFYPLYSDYQLDKETDKAEQEVESYISNFNNASSDSSSTEENTSETTKSDRQKSGHSVTKKKKTVITEEDKKNDSLYKEIDAYNQSIYENKQSNLKDAWSYIQSPVSLKSLKTNVYGIIRIPRMRVRLPLYLGASGKHLSHGAAVMGQTSIPIGTSNTNSVIAGHRGWNTGSFFRHIERMRVGDYVYITNPWQTLRYKVTSIDIVSPYDTEKIKIQEEKDMITLLTCHPYLSHGNKYRYLVYCERDSSYTGSTQYQNTSETYVVSETEKTLKNKSIKDYVNEAIGKNDKASNMIVTSNGSQYESSEVEIDQEDSLRNLGAIVSIFFIAIWVISLLNKLLKFVFQKLKGG